MSDKCARCGEVGEDRRTLWMACLYAMEELGIPLDQRFLFHAELDDCQGDDGERPHVEPYGEPLASQMIMRPSRVRHSGELCAKPLYTLCVCKQCRADWMMAIKRWFAEKPEWMDDENGVPTRVFGATRMRAPSRGGGEEML